MKSAKIAIIALMSLSMSTAFADRRGHGGGHHRPVHHVRPVHPVRPIHHVSPVHHYNHNHYGHAHSTYYTTYYPYYYNGFYYSSPWWHTHHGSTYSGGTTTVDVTCAPATMEKNTFAAEAVLVGLAQNELKGNAVFTQKVADFQAMTGAQKIDEGMRIAGVKNPRDAKEVLALIYAREASAESVARVSDNLKMSEKEAKLVVTSVTQALKQR